MFQLLTLNAISQNQ